MRSTAAYCVRLARECVTDQALRAHPVSTMLFPGHDDRTSESEQMLARFEKFDIDKTRPGEAIEDIGSIVSIAENPLTTKPVSMVFGGKDIHSASSLQVCSFNCRSGQIQRNRENVNSARSQHAQNLAETCQIILDMLEHFS